MKDIDIAYDKLARSSVDLCAFVLVCRSGTLSHAARVLKMSQPSLSVRIKNLETTLGTTLFLRKSTGVTMTATGRALFGMLQDPMDRAALQFQTFRDRARKDRVVLSVDHAFAALWLLPRLPQLREELGSTDICIVTSQDPAGVEGAETDIEVYMARADQRDAQADLLFFEDVSAICSPAFMHANPGLKQPADLIDLGVPLIHLRPPCSDTPWLDWQHWFAAGGVPAPQLPVETEFNTYEMVVRAAQSGQGVALGWNVLLDTLLADQQLVRPFSKSISTNVGYYIRSTATNQTPKQRRVHEWIVAQATGSALPPTRQGK
ncbi:LysR family transcriptional regulator [Cognatishimia sp. WU-CL00825]|uniref:LysR substrate-binding domain-containing protein n=1 Tax=Cognatishimia sp. WU-CL00825 TaxID=3127658 RepID=UPI003108DAB4